MGRGDKKRRKAGIQKGQKLPRVQKESDSTDKYEEEHFGRLERPERNIYAMASDDMDSSLLTPSKLRPKSSKSPGTATAVSTDTLLGNRIFAVGKLEKLYNDFYKLHREHSPNCEPTISFAPKLERQWGLAVEEGLRCESCGLHGSSQRLFEEVQRINQRGRLAAKVNIQLQVALSKLPIGNAAVRLIFASLDLPVPCASALQYLSSKVSKTCVDTNEEQMSANRDMLKQFLQMCNSHCSDNGELKFSAQSDVCYNNSAKSRAFSQPGTQAMAPLIENETSSKMVVAFSTVNKHCATCEKTSNHEHVGCTRTYRKNAPIGNSEKVLSARNADTVYHDGLSMEFLCTDNDGAMVSAAQEAASLQQKTAPKKMDCTVHLSRGLKRQFYKIPLSSPIFESVPQASRKHFREMLARAAQSRCHAEVKGAMQKYGKEEIKFCSRLTSAADNIIQCFTGNHKSCRSCSFVCKQSGKGQKLPKYLPGNKNLTLSPTAKGELRRLLDYQMGPRAGAKQRLGMNTNKSEATHLRCLKSVPKNRLYKTNFEGRCHSAIHTASVGLGTSIQVISEKLGAKQASTQNLYSLQARDAYWKNRIKTIKFLQRRRQLSRQKMKSSIRTSAYRSGHLDSGIRDDHTYGQ